MLNYNKPPFGGFFDDPDGKIPINLHDAFPRERTSRNIFCRVKNKIRVLNLVGMPVVVEIREASPFIK